MDWLDVLSDINYWAVIAAVVSSFVVGSVWYAKGVFGKAWMKELGLKDKDLEDKAAMQRAMMHTAIASFFGATTLACLLYATGTDGWADSTVFGAVVGFGISMSSVVTHDVFSRVSMTLTRIHGFYDVVKFAVMGAIIGAIGVVG